MSTMKLPRRNFKHSCKDWIQTAKNVRRNFDWSISAGRPIKMLGHSLQQHYYDRPECVILQIGTKLSGLNPCGFCVVWRSVAGRWKLHWAWPRLPARLASRGPAIGFHAIHRYRNWVSNVEGAYSKVPLVRHTDFLLETELCSPLQTQPAVGIWIIDTSCVCVCVPLRFIWCPPAPPRLQVLHLL